MAKAIFKWVQRFFFLAVLVAGGLLLFGPDSEYMYIDTQSSETPAILVTSNPGIFDKYLNRWVESTLIRKLDGVDRRDDWSGYPNLAIIEPGNHTLQASCTWHWMTLRIAGSQEDLEVQLAPGVIYRLKSKYISMGQLLENDCVVWLVELDQQDIVTLDEEGYNTLMRLGYLKPDE